MYKRYESYKDSGIEWIGEIPEHWTDYKLKQLFLLIGGNGFNEALQGKKEGDYPFYKVSDINFGEPVISEASNYVDRSDIIAHRWNVIPKNSILMAKIGEALRKNHRKVNNADCIIDNNMLALIPRNQLIDTWFAYYLFTKIDMDWYVNPGAVPSVNIRWLKNSRLFLMPESEQINIVNFLDHKTSEIDFLIADKEELIKKLEEYKQSIITEAVTKGLNPDVKMKDSGIEWIGEIPEHWSTVQLRRLLRSGSEGIKIGPFGSQLKLDDLEELGYKVYGQENLIKNNFQIGKRFLSPNKFNELDVYQILSGDLLISMMGTIGRSQIVPDDIETGIMDSHLIRLRFIKSVYATFIRDLFGGAYYVKYQTSMTSKGSIMAGLNSTIVKNIIVALPPYKEQKELSNYIYEKSRLCENLIGNIKEQILNLKQYRQSLIYEAVTGKIDVRDYQPERSEQLA